MAAEADRGRGLVSAALAEALAAAIDGSGRLALLVGEAGIGKTTTARELTARARRAGVTVRWAACSSGGATVAHGPWLTVLSGLGEPGRTGIDALVGSEVGDTSAAAAARGSAYAAVLGALEDATVERPALLVLDDLHWADEGTLQLLDVVAAHLPGLPVLVVGTYRDVDAPVASPLHRLGGRADHHPLHGLDRDAVAALLGDQLGAARAAELAPDVIDLTAGNPFLVLQIARLLGEGGADLGSGALPSGARDLLEQRLRSLSPEDRAVLGAAAVLGTPFRATDLEVVAALTTAEVASALDRAAARRVVERAPGTGAWSFVHDLFRQAVLDASPPADRAALHRQAAAVLEQEDAEASVIAAHLLAASAHDGGLTDAAALWSVRAGDRALAAMAWEEAAGHHERALASLTSGRVPAVRADALAGLGRARLLAGDDAGAGRAFDALAALARTEGSAPLLARAALGFSADLSGFEVRLFDQHQIDLLEEADRALAASAPADAAVTALRAIVLARLSVALSLSAAEHRRLDLAERAVALGREAGEPIALAQALAAHCDAIAGPDDVVRREAEASEIIAIAGAAGDGPLELLGRRLRYVARLEQGDIAGVEDDMTAFAGRAGTIGNPLYSWYLPLWQAQLAVVGGAVDEADRLIDEAEALGLQAGSTNAPMLAIVLRLAVLWQRGEFGEAVGRVDALGEVAPELAVYVSALGSFALANVLAGRPVVATSYLDRAVALRLEDQPVDAEWLPNVTNLVRAAAALDHPLLPTALRMLEPHAHLVSFEGIGAGLYGSAARFAAIGCSALGRHEDAVRYAEQALAVNRGFGGVLAADGLRTLADSRAARGAPGDAAAAAELHDQADAAYAAIGAHHLRRAPVEEGAATPEPTPDRAGGNELHRDGDVWHLTYAGTSTIVRHSKGLADLAVLLVRPGQEVHVTELEGVRAAAMGSRGDDALDRRAIDAYKGRLVELSEELAEAEDANDLGRADRARLEYDALVDQLTGAVGLGGRARPAGPDPVDRARKAVSARIRDAIRRIEAAHEPLGRHLANAVRTGTYCSYQPEVPTLWRCQTGSGAGRA